MNPFPFSVFSRFLGRGPCLFTRALCVPPFPPAPPPPSAPIPPAPEIHMSAVMPADSCAPQEVEQSPLLPPVIRVS